MHGVRLDIFGFEGSLLRTVRRARIHYPGAVYHVILRETGGKDFFFDESDRIRFSLTPPTHNCGTQGLLQTCSDSYAHTLLARIGA